MNLLDCLMNILFDNLLNISSRRLYFIIYLIALIPHAYSAMVRVSLFIHRTATRRSCGLRSTVILRPCSSWWRQGLIGMPRTM